MDEISKEIITTLRESGKPLSTQDIATNINRHWSTVQTRCLKLQNKGKVGGFRVGRTNVWVYKPEGDEEADLEVLNI